MASLGTLGGTWSAAASINNTGQIAGSSSLAGDQIQHAFLYSNGEMTDLGTLGGSNSTGASTPAGEVVGSAFAINGFQNAFRDNNGAGMIDLGTMGRNTSVAYGINKLWYGEIVGYSLTSSGQQNASCTATEK